MKPKDIFQGNNTPMTLLTHPIELRLEDIRNAICVLPDAL